MANTSHPFSGLADPFELIPGYLRQQTRDVFGFAGKALGAGTMIEAHWVIGNTDLGESILVPTDTSGPQEKSESAEHARTVAAMQGADFVFSIGETWALSPEDVPKHANILKKYGSISQYPGRVDTFFIYLECQEGLFSVMAPILAAPPSKKKRRLGKPWVVKVDHALGTLAQILPLASKPSETIH